MPCQAHCLIPLVLSTIPHIQLVSVITVWVKDKMNRWIKTFINEWMYEHINEWTNWLQEQVNEWMNKCANLSLPFPLGSRPLQAHNIFSLHFFQPLSPKHNPEVAYIPGERNMSMCSFNLLIKLLKCEIIVESHAVVKEINKEHQYALHSVPPPPPPPW